MNLDEVDKKINEILAQNNLKISYEISFPAYRILPDEVKLALRVLEKNGMRIIFALKQKAPVPGK